jgi:hypothetical protein
MTLWALIAQTNMLKHAKRLKGVTTLRQDALKFASQVEHHSFDRFLLKEMIHHIPVSSMNTFYHGLYNGLDTNGICLTITRSRDAINDYPLSPAVKQRWMDTRDDANVYKNASSTAGFDTTLTTHRRRTKISRLDWLFMIENRMWSHFGEDHFTEESLKNELQYIKQNVKQDVNGMIRFWDPVVLIKGVKC